MRNRSHLLNFLSSGDHAHVHFHTHILAVILLRHFSRNRIPDACFHDYVLLPFLIISTIQADI
jgi:hypothetical protein